MFQGNLKFQTHTEYILTLCNQRLYLLKLLRNRGMCPKQICIVFHALIMSRLMYAFPAWGGFVSVEETNRINDATDMDTLIRFTVCQTSGGSRGGAKRLMKKNFSV